MVNHRFQWIALNLVAYPANLVLHRQKTPGVKKSGAPLGRRPNSRGEGWPRASVIATRKTQREFVIARRQTPAVEKRLEGNAPSERKLPRALKPLWLESPERKVPWKRKGFRARLLPGQHNVRGSRRGDVLGAGVSQRWQVDAFEQRFARAEQDRRDGDVHFIDQPLLQVLPDGRGPASDADIHSVGGFARLIEGVADAASDEVKGGAAFHDERSASVIREHENWLVIHGVIAPPALPTVVQPGTADGSEHIPAHDPGADIAESPGGKVVIDAGLSAVGAEQLGLKGARGKGPAVKTFSADAERVVQALFRAGAEAVDGDGEAFYAEFAHGLFFGVCLEGRIGAQKAQYEPIPDRPSSSMGIPFR